MDGRDTDDGSKKKPKSRRPGNTAFRQQRLKAWQPILTPKTVLPLFFIVGVIFAPIGGLLLWASSQVQEVVIEYTNCLTDAPQEKTRNLTTYKDIPSGNTVRTSFQSSTIQQPRWQTFNQTNPLTNRTERVCSLEFLIPNTLPPPVFLYYRLTNFYQNHRRYVKSAEESQLKGEAVSKAALISSDHCSPLIIDPVVDKPYFPCGLIANSFFNDTFSNPLMANAAGDNSPNKTYYMTDKGIAWSSDRARYKKTNYKPDEVVPPPNWRELYGDTYTTLPDLSEMESFQVWMRTAGLPTFSKLARQNSNATMERGTYYVDIVDRFNVKAYGGTKSLVISTTNVMGGKNPFLGIAYIVVGGLCVLLGAIFAARHLIKPRKLGDHTYLSWNNEPSTATATGRDVN